MINIKKLVRQHKTLLAVTKSINKQDNIAYVAGKVTGLPYDEVYEKFKKRQKELEAAGFIVINPCEHIDKDEDWNNAMKICLFLLQFANCISLLPDWQDSRGATMEVEHAISLKIQFLNH